MRKTGAFLQSSRFSMLTDSLCDDNNHNFAMDEMDD